MNKVNPQQEDPEAVDGPAIVTPMHVQNRDIFNDSGALVIGKKGHRKWTPLEAAYEQGKLGPKDSQDARSRFMAGIRYSEIWDRAQSAGRDSTQALNGSRGGGSGLPITQAQSDAVRALVAIHAGMSARDRIIVRLVCGEGYFPSEAVKLAAGDDYKNVVPARFREALDALCDAIEAVRKQPGRVA